MRRAERTAVLCEEKSGMRAPVFIPAMRAKRRECLPHLSQLCSSRKVLEKSGELPAKLTGRVEGQAIDAVVDKLVYALVLEGDTRIEGEPGRRKEALTIARSLSLSLVPPVSISLSLISASFLCLCFLRPSLFLSFFVLSLVL